jgi:hypothetical protein
MNNNDYIFQLREDDGCKYKGAFFADLDVNNISEKMGISSCLPKDYHAGLFALIWTDKEGMWHLKGRIKSSSGSKQVITFEPKKDSNIQELIDKLCQVPVKNTLWIQNLDESVHGILKIIRDEEMVEYEKTTNTKDTNE